MKAEALEESEKGVRMQDVADADDGGSGGETKADILMEGMKWEKVSAVACLYAGGKRVDKEHNQKRVLRDESD